MTNKGPKIKRYKSIYDDSAQKRKRMGSAVAITLICAVFLFVGYSLSGVWSEFIDTVINPAKNTVSDPYVSSELPAVSDEPAITPPVEVEAPSEEELQKAEREEKIKTFKGVFMPANTFYDDTAFSLFLQNARAKGYNTIVFELKDGTGHLYYKTDSKAVLAAQPLINEAADLAARTNAMKEAGFIAVPKIHAFQDNLASKNIPNSYAMYMSLGETRWIDNSVDKGGRSWLNPESEVAQNYITNICTDIVSYGFEYIIVDSLQYPSGLALDKAFFGERSITDRIGVLSDYAEKLEQALLGKNCTLILMSTATAQMNGNADYYGGNPLNIPVENVASSILPAYFPQPLSAAGNSGGEEIANPSDKPYESTKTVVSAIKKAGAGNVHEILPFIQYFDGYQEKGADEQIRALEENEISCYVLYNTEGIY